MARNVGVLTTERISVALVDENRVSGEVIRFPEDGEEQEDALLSLHAEAFAGEIAERVRRALGGEEAAAVGVGMPGVIRNGVVEESPNLQQLKGFHMKLALESALRTVGILAPVLICNDADVMAAGIAASRRQLHRLIRVWTLGNGIGFGLYPSAEGAWEGGHSVVTLDPKEAYCGCGGVGHLEGIMGQRAMRLRFLDREPEEVFADAQAGDARCAEFVRIWHRALAAATATSVHMAGPGKFYITGPNARFVQVPLLNDYLQQMVKMSPLQGSSFEVVPGGEEIAIIGAAVNAARAL